MSVLSTHTVYYFYERS